MRSGRQQNNRRVGALITGQREQGMALHVVEPRELPDLTLIEHAGQRSGAHQPVLKRVSHAGRRLRAVGDDPPLSARRSRDIHGVRVQVRAALRRDSDTWPQKMRIRENKCGRKQALREGTAALRKDQTESR